jgi:hypothetical protein
MTDPAPPTGSGIPPASAADANEPADPGSRVGRERAAMARSCPISGLGRRAGARTHPARRAQPSRAVHRQRQGQQPPSTRRIVNDRSSPDNYDPNFRPPRSARRKTASGWATHSATPPGPYDAHIGEPFVITKTRSSSCPCWYRCSLVEVLAPIALRPERGQRMALTVFAVLNLVGIKRVDPLRLLGIAHCAALIDRHRREAPTPLDAVKYAVL